MKKLSKVIILTLISITMLFSTITANSATIDEVEILHRLKN